MRALLQLALIGALLLLAGGTVVAPHVDPPGRPTTHADHVASAYHLSLLTQLVPELDPRGGAAFVGDPPAAGLAGLVLALGAPLVLARPGSRARAALPRRNAQRPQWRLSTLHAPPRSS